MKITFEGETLQHVVANIGDFLRDLTKNDHDLAASAPEETPEPTRRRRRARSTEETAPDTAKGRTRRRASASSPSEEEKPKRTRRSRKAPDDDIKDTDLSKAASGLADATNPKVVMDLLGDFGVTKVGELEGDQRREFLTAAAELVADA